MPPTQQVVLKSTATPMSYTLPQQDFNHASVNSVFKRLIDVLGAMVGLVVTAVLFAPIAIAIQLDNPGPVLYRQVRCGHRGKEFHIWKFRSMVTNADAIKHLVENKAEGNIFKNENDPRITRVGRFLRKTSLDEFPQFWNVLMGDMSLVGTRPPTVDEVMRYTSRHWERLEVKWSNLKKDWLPIGLFAVLGVVICVSG
ncbi:MAG: sugar transferase, partial [Leptolyngbya sp. SIO1D8]|nr:sugar transferase [Leptolyngbya sp. SIO1D8]